MNCWFQYSIRTSSSLIFENRWTSESHFIFATTPLFERKRKKGKKGDCSAGDSHALMFFSLFSSHISNTLWRGSWDMLARRRAELSWPSLVNSWPKRTEGATWTSVSFYPKAVRAPDVSLLFIAVRLGSSGMELRRLNLLPNPWTSRVPQHLRPLWVEKLFPVRHEPFSASAIDLDRGSIRGRIH